MIRVDHLIKRFGRAPQRAVDDLSFTVAPGEALALWGANGAGKTTAIRCVLGLLRYQGAIAINGRDARRHGKAARRALGYVPQELALHDDLGALEALHFYGRLKRAPWQRPLQVLAEVGLADHGRKKVRELSGGMKQRLALAIALLADPPLLVLDELTASLDAEARHGFIDLLRTLRQRGKTILFTSHRLDEVERLADHVLVLENGRKRLECAGHELAEALGLRSVLKVVVDNGLISQAVTHLQSEGFIASPNGVGLYVDVAPQSKALPLRALAEASIVVHDFEVLSDQSSPLPSPRKGEGVALIHKEASHA
jgi:ABC-type multidrug transport system ATPase subunit